MIRIKSILLLCMIFRFYSADAATTSIGTIIPFYIYPTKQAIQPLIDAKRSYRKVPMVVILNPNSGPGASKDETYAKAVTRLQQKGIKVVGYVHTSYGNRSTTEVQGEIQQWASWYKPDGIFLDEMASEQTKQSYYGALSNFIKASPQSMSLVIANPGIAVATSWATYADIIIVYEHSKLPSSSDYGAWQTAGLAPQKAGILLYNASTAPAQELVNNVKGFVGWIYATNGNLPNPWGTLPKYLTTLMQGLAAAK